MARKNFKVVLFGKYPIETVFDHASEEELKEFTKHCMGIPRTPYRLEDYKYKYNLKAYIEWLESMYKHKKKRLTPQDIEEIQDRAYVRISEFYNYKKDYKKAMEYALKIKDTIIRYPIIAPLGAKLRQPKAIP